jgi:hypothetical protein
LTLSAEVAAGEGGSGEEAKTLNTCDMYDVFTPRDYYTNERLRFAASEIKVIEGHLFGRGLGRHAIVEIRDHRYAVYGASCGLPNCQCDARIKLIGPAALDTFLEKADIPQV